MKYPQLEICAIIVIQVLCVIENSTQSSELNQELPKQEILTTSVQPGPNVWVGESIALECKLSHATPTATAVWHRVLLDPAGRKLRSLGLEDNLSSELEIIIVRERTAELISHGDLLLISDPRFRLKVRRGNHTVTYRLEIESTKLEDSGDYECQMTSTEDNDYSNSHKVLNQRIEVNVFQKHVPKGNQVEERSRKKQFQVDNNQLETISLNNKQVNPKVPEQEASSMQVQQSTMAMEIGSHSIIMSSSGRHQSTPFHSFHVLQMMIPWLFKFMLYNI